MGDRSVGRPAVRRGRSAHLARRFVTSLRGRSPEPADQRWVEGLLSPNERGLWERMTPTDQAHGVEVARRTIDSFDEPEVLRAALLHDVGKIEGRAGVMLRVVATLLGPVVSQARAASFAQRGGVIGTVGRQLRYPALGAELLAVAGSPTIVVQWAAEHHHAAYRWTVDPEVGRVLSAADDASS